jgi:predicted AlkP superfamily pyrophosphatase or phosphodiesterase
MRILLTGAVALASLWAQPKHTIIIGVDGMGAAGVRAGQRDNTVPRLEELRRRGAWSLRARAVLPTVSSPNWASVIMGAGPEQHGITSNDWQPEKVEIPPVCTGMAGYFPTVFSLLRQQQPRRKTAVIHDWEGFGRLVEPGAASFRQHVKGGSRATTEFALEYWKRERPDLLFVHLDDVDHAGHDHTWESAEYRRAVAEHDALIGRFVDMVREAGEESRTVFVVVADHGGTGKRHGGATLAEIEIPLLIAGPGVRAGELAGPVNIQDVAGTLAALYKLKAPACWEGKAVGLR